MSEQRKVMLLQIVVVQDEMLGMLEDVLLDLQLVGEGMMKLYVRWVWMELQIVELKD